MIAVGDRPLRFLGVVIVCSVVLGGCMQGKRPFMQAQICLPGPQDRAAFIRMIRAVGEVNHMTYLDRSASTEGELRATDHVLSNLGQHDPVMNLGLLGKDNVDMTATNLGLPKHEIVIGFSEGSDPARAHRLADEVVNELKQKWHVELVPQGQGARGMKWCVQ
jgi:hypothetical protein